MATQYEYDIPFSATHQQQAFKLLELPPELLALLESDAPPTPPPSLTITSSPLPPHHAHLSVSNGKTYLLRQKNTSNPIMILSPSTTFPSTEDGHEDDGDSFVPRPAVTRIASVEDTIELIEKQEGAEKEKPVKVNKWHEKFAKSRGTTGGAGKG
ncbi:sister chromatid cohesion DCC1 protein [Rutstroemia sp. NJR-2017a WRK4]|nr:sister chromatid cohesion DCC1 protein [Rutstroemia sp. NJR-2017a WRK4]